MPTWTWMNSDNGRFRSRVEATWAPAGPLLGILTLVALRPPPRDGLALYDRALGIARANGYGAVRIEHLAERVVDHVADLERERDLGGPFWASNMVSLGAASRIVLCGWGVLSPRQDADVEMTAVLQERLRDQIRHARVCLGGATLACLGTTKAGEPLAIERRTMSPVLVPFT